MTSLRDLLTLPNTFSLLRLLMAPLALVLAVNQQETLYLLAIAFSVFTDLLDGFLARSLNQITELGSKLDSWGDFAIYSTMAVCAFILWPEQVVEHAYASLTIVLSFTLPALTGLIKFRTFTSYHTWSVKIAVAMTIIAYLLLFTGVVAWPYYLAASLAALAALEEVLITLLIHRSHSDVRTLRQALRIDREENENLSGGKS